MNLNVDRGEGWDGGRQWGRRGPLRGGRGHDGLLLLGQLRDRALGVHLLGEEQLAQQARPLLCPLSSPLLPWEREYNWLQ